MKKLILVCSSLISIIGAKPLAEMLFGGPITEPDEIVTGCAILIFLTLVAIYHVICGRFSEAAAVRMSRYTARRDARFREIEAARFMLNYELMRADFLEGREGENGDNISHY